MQQKYDTNLCTYTRMYMDACIHTHMYIHTHARSHTHAHAHTLLIKKP